MARTGRYVVDVVGGTPLVQLAAVAPDAAADVCIKLGWSTPTGSNKDRMAIAIVEEAGAAGLGPARTDVTVACDTGLKYLGGDLHAR